jgi:uncharacterized protein (TIGR02391 family)
VEHIAPFSPQHLEAACRVLADTDRGLTGSEIGYLLQDVKVADVSPDFTKWKRLFNALAGAQNKHKVGNHLIMFINRALNPVSYARKREAFEWRRDELNVVLAFSGFFIREDGKVVRSDSESTLDGARQRAGRMRAALENRNVHAEVLNYCRAELIQENYFHAVLEAVKGVAERVRLMSGLVSDGAELVNEAFGLKAPLLAINLLATDSEKSEQKGFTQLLIGLFGTVRNPLAHAPKIAWPMPEQDALDILTLVSFVHRKLDATTKVPTAGAAS